MELITHRLLIFFFFNDTATTEIYTLSLHDALPISTIPWRHNGGSVTTLASSDQRREARVPESGRAASGENGREERRLPRSEEHTSEIPSRQYLVCRLLLEKKKIHKS